MVALPPAPAIPLLTASATVKDVLSDEEGRVERNTHSL